MFSVLCEPQLLTDVIDTYLESGYILTSASHGMPLLDSTDSQLNFSYFEFQAILFMIPLKWSLILVTKDRRNWFCITLWYLFY